jgi:hypothetical protein
MLSGLKEQLAEVEKGFAALRKLVEGRKAIPHLIGSRLAVALDRVRAALDRQYEAVDASAAK